MKTLVTRSGPGTKFICLGDIKQIDTPYITEMTSGLAYVAVRFRGWEHGAHVTLTKGERSRLTDFAAENL
jgi:PhoH-like ATPase